MRQFLIVLVALLLASPAAAQWTTTELDSKAPLERTYQIDYSFTAQTNSAGIDTSGCSDLRQSFDASTGDASADARVQLYSCPSDTSGDAPAATAGFQTCGAITGVLTDGASSFIAPGPFTRVRVVDPPSSDTARVRLTCTSPVGEFTGYSWRDSADGSPDVYGINAQGIGDESTITALNALENFGPWPEARSHYYFATSAASLGADGRSWGTPSDSCAGTDPSCPKRLVSAMNAVVAPFVWIHLKPGDTWSDANGFMDEWFQEDQAGVGLRADCSASIGSGLEHCVRITSDGGKAHRAVIDADGYDPGASTDPMAMLLIEQDDPENGVFAVANVEFYGDSNQSGNYGDIIDCTGSRCEFLNLHASATSVNQAFESEFRTSGGSPLGVSVTCVGCSGHADNHVVQMRDGTFTFVGEWDNTSAGGEDNFEIDTDQTARTPVGCGFIVADNGRATFIGHRLSGTIELSGGDNTGLLCARGDDGGPATLLSAAKSILWGSFGDPFGAGVVITTDAATDPVGVDLFQVTLDEVRQGIVVTSNGGTDPCGYIELNVEGLIADTRRGDVGLVDAGETPWFQLDCDPAEGLWAMDHVRLGVNQSTYSVDNTEIWKISNSTTNDAYATTFGAKTEETAGVRTDLEFQAGQEPYFQWVIGPNVADFDHAVGGHPPVNGSSTLCDLPGICIAPAPHTVKRVPAYQTISDAYLGRAIVGFDLTLDALGPTKAHGEVLE